MPPRSLLRAFLALWALTGVVLLIASLATVRAALSTTHGDPHVVLLGGLEAVAALLFLIPPAMRVGAVGLLATIAVALGVHTVMGQWRGDLLLYAAAVGFIAVHGPLTSAQWRAALARPGASAC